MEEMTPAEFHDARQRLGYTLREMAEALGITLTSVWRKENDRQPVTERDARAVQMMVAHLGRRG